MAHAKKTQSGINVQRIGTSLTFDCIYNQASTILIMGVQCFQRILTN